MLYSLNFSLYGYANKTYIIIKTWLCKYNLQNPPVKLEVESVFYTFAVLKLTLSLSSSASTRDYIHCLHLTEELKLYTCICVCYTYYFGHITELMRKIQKRKRQELGGGGEQIPKMIFTSTIFT